jgi:hypothetical protein
MNEAGMVGLSMMAARVAVDVEQVDVDGVTVYTALPRGVDPKEEAVYLDVHVAPYCGGGESCGAMAAGTTRMPMAVNRLQGARR